ncbi:uncharacterized protein L3040_005624 [Drepanopeziza brunnea f. sp. 'multigermtubi']|uniref:Uncharacterized protein n=1 Tax=Marssonina brunnea f. sp. multigermtubi (strain MB_m1) TaxID=1072389 RepID=K1W959_MARBU|nr:uncharacterized protein MBM_07961 [Drepanopeziza brunnea f. sp. 'multigermtubi' MB_m1]EKD13760.1 hypothetical protein MBM_07961 [Drepanopeziza brunnea f. sp. 'multigermtubi' MB_m1]KAJ5041069.1 hypothetical protein L3040_005624 [Drepanopeziza brunnea f. sp. 'multigermtubi']
MPIEQLTFDPDGDPVLRFVYPLAKREYSQYPGRRILMMPQTPSALVQSPNPHGGAGEGAVEPQKEVDMLVSSKRLSLASPVLKAMLQGSFRESYRYQILRSTGTGRVEVRAPWR